MDNFKEYLLNLFFPRFCLGCKREGNYLCEDCRSTLDICERTYFVNSKNLSGLYFALPYKERQLTKKMIYQFKYEPYLKDLSKTLTSILIEHFIKTGNNTNKFWENSILVAIPADKKRLKLRGYNQCQELANELAKIVKVPLLTNNLIKIKQTKPQMELSKNEREINLKNAFIIKNPAEFAGKKVFLVDDVYTTGSTMDECAGILLNAGAKEVFGIAIAREE